VTTSRRLLMRLWRHAITTNIISESESEPYFFNQGFERTQHRTTPSTMINVCDRLSSHVRAHPSRQWSP
jgi:hypothetical protein